MKYVFFISETLCTNNKLQTAVEEFIHKYDRSIIGEHETAWFQNMLIKGVQKLNGEFPRCKPVTLRFWRPNYVLGKISDNDILIDQPDFIRGKLLACTEVSNG